MTSIAPAPITAITGTAGGVSNDTARVATRDNLEKAGQRFESIFVGMMLKSMRQAKLGDGLFDNKAGEQFRDMMDGKIAEDMAAHTPIGIGKAMVDFLSKAPTAPAEAPADETGAKP